MFSRIARWFVAALALGALAAAAVAFLARDHLFAWGTEPGVRYEDMAAIPRPVYLFPESWAARPDFESRALSVPEGVAPAAGADAAVDVFYVHPDAYWGDDWNAHADDPALRALVDGPLMAVEASAFNGCCRVFAPRYRAVHAIALDRPSASGRRALDLATADIDRAFDHFFHRERAGRPYIVVGHGQGAVLAMRLLDRRIDGQQQMFDDLVAVYLIGAGVPLERFAHWGRLRPCESADDSGCVVAFEALAEGADPDVHTNVREIWYDRRWVRLDRVQTLCTNPLTWRRDEEPAPAAANAGALAIDSGYDPTALHRRTPQVDADRFDALPALTPEFAGARCQSGKLYVSLPSDPPLRGSGPGGGNLDAHAVTLFWADLRENARTRAAAFLAAQRQG